MSATEEAMPTENVPSQEEVIAQAKTDLADEISRAEMAIEVAKRQGKETSEIPHMRLDHYRTFDKMTALAKAYLGSDPTVTSGRKRVKEEMFTHTSYEPRRAGRAKPAKESKRKVSTYPFLAASTTSSRILPTDKGEAVIGLTSTELIPKRRFVPGIAALGSLAFGAGRNWDENQVDEHLNLTVAGEPVVTDLHPRVSPEELLSAAQAFLALPDAPNPA